MCKKCFDAKESNVARLKQLEILNTTITNNDQPQETKEKDVPAKSDGGADEEEEDDDDPDINFEVRAEKLNSTSNSNENYSDIDEHSSIYDTKPNKNSSKLKPKGTSIK